MPKATVLEFENRLHDPRDWAFTAQVLRRAAQILWERSNDAMREVQDKMRGRDQPVSLMEVPEALDVAIHSQALLLYGLGIEDLIKACIVAKDPSQPCKNKQGKIVWPGGGDGHDQVLLLDKGEISCEGLDRKILEILTDVVRWQGRYPVPRKEYPEFMVRWFPAREAIEDCFEKLIAVLQNPLPGIRGPQP